MRKVVAFSLLLVFVLAGCADPQPVDPTSAQSINLPVSQYTVAEVFHSYYEAHNGPGVIGAPIGPELVDENGLTFQNFQNGRLEHYPDMPAGERVRLARLSVKALRPTPCIGVESAVDALYFGCHSIRAGFREYFEKNGGLSFFGYPVTEQYIRQGSLIQHFERAIIIWDAQQKTFRLFEVGRYECWHQAGAACDLPEDMGSATYTSEPLADPIRKFYEAHGGARLFGVQVGGPRIGEDGAQEIVYQNVIIYEDLAAPEGARLRPLGIQVAQAAPTQPATPANEPNSAYYTTTGHNVLFAFYAFYTQNGGEAMFGQPLTEAYPVNGKLHQVFENGVIVASVAVDAQTHLLNLGELSLADSTERLATPQSLRMTYTMLEPVITDPTLPQSLTVRVTDETGAPVSGARVQFIVGLPSGPIENVTETNVDGYASHTFLVTDYIPMTPIIFKLNASYNALTTSEADSFTVWVKP